MLFGLSKGGERELGVHVSAEERVSTRCGISASRDELMTIAYRVTNREYLQAIFLVEKIKPGERVTRPARLQWAIYCWLVAVIR